MEHKKRYHVDFYKQPPLTLGAVNIYQIASLAAASDLQVAPHRQPCHEITYIVEGRGVFERNGKEYPVEKGDLFILKTGDNHAITSSRQHPLEYLCFGFTFCKGHTDYEKISDVATLFEKIDNPKVKDTYHCQKYLSGALEEISFTAECSQEMLYCYLLQIIIATYRSFCGKAPRQQQATFHIHINPLVYDMIHYIDSHLDTVAPLQAMSHKLGYSYCYLSRLFSSVMGNSLRQYYTMRRMERAAELLQNTRTLSEVAERLGFADTPTFCKAFKKYYNISPGAYRKQ